MPFCTFCKIDGHPTHNACYQCGRPFSLTPFNYCICGKERAQGLMYCKYCETQVPFFFKRSHSPTFERSRSPTNEISTLPGIAFTPLPVTELNDGTFGLHSTSDEPSPKIRRLSSPTNEIPALPRIEFTPLTVTRLDTLGLNEGALKNWLTHVQQRKSDDRKRLWESSQEQIINEFSQISSLIIQLNCFKIVLSSMNQDLIKAFWAPIKDNTLRTTTDATKLTLLDLSLTSRNKEIPTDIWPTVEHQILNNTLQIKYSFLTAAIIGKNRNVLEKFSTLPNLQPVTKYFMGQIVENQQLSDQIVMENLEHLSNLNSAVTIISNFLGLIPLEKTHLVQLFCNAQCRNSVAWLDKQRIFLNFLAQRSPTNPNT